MIMMKFVRNKSKYPKAAKQEDQDKIWTNLNFLKQMREKKKSKTKHLQSKN